jgi:hypothetical protein
MVLLNGGIGPLLNKQKIWHVVQIFFVRLWAETISIVNYLINLSPTRANGGLTCHQQLFGVPPCFCHLRVFGCISFVLISAHRTKWSSKSLHFVFIDYNSTFKGYCCFLPEKKQIHCGCYFL